MDRDVRHPRADAQARWDATTTTSQIHATVASSVTTLVKATCPPAP
jgi:hypothetical protein